MAQRPEYVKCINCKSFQQQKNNCDKCISYSHFDLKSEQIGLNNTSVKSAFDKQISGSHYKYKAIQPIQYIHANKLGFCEGNVIKYVTRHKDKNGRADIEKAIHYLELLLELEYSNVPGQRPTQVG